MATFTYLLCDDSGVSNSENEILLPKGVEFYHEFGVYKVLNYRNDNGDIVKKLSEISQIECERIRKAKN